jgi:hypothetical protein
MNHNIVIATINLHWYGYPVLRTQTLDNGYIYDPVSALIASWNPSPVVRMICSCRVETDRRRAVVELVANTWYRFRSSPLRSTGENGLTTCRNRIVVSKSAGAPYGVSIDAGTFATTFRVDRSQNNTSSPPYTAISKRPRVLTELQTSSCTFFGHRVPFRFTTGSVINLHATHSLLSGF